MTRTGKIARLPREVRESLNRRLHDNEPGPALLAWLNGLPEARDILDREFAGARISKQNLSEWRAGGFKEWQLRQDTLAQAREFAAEAADLAVATGDRLADHLATFLAAQYAAAARQRLAGAQGPQRWEVLREMVQDFSLLRRGDHAAARLQLDREELEWRRANGVAQQERAFREWIQRPEVRQEFLPETAGGLRPETLRRIEEELHLL